MRLVLCRSIRRYRIRSGSRTSSQGRRFPCVVSLCCYSLSGVRQFPSRSQAKRRLPPSRVSSITEELKCPCRKHPQAVLRLRRGVTGRKRWKDAAGTYYCDPCWIKKVEAHRQSARLAARTPTPSASDQDDAAIEIQVEDEVNSPIEIVEVEVEEAVERVPERTAGTIACARCDCRISRDQAYYYDDKPFCFDCIGEVADASVAQIAPSRPRAIAIVARSSVDLMETRRCPFCNEQIQAIAKKCKHCGGVARSSPSQAAGSSNPGRSILLINAAGAW